jgi:hypothetical protein
MQQGEAAIDVVGRPGDPIFHRLSEGLCRGHDVEGLYRRRARRKLREDSGIHGEQQGCARVDDDRLFRDDVEAVICRVDQRRRTHRQRGYRPIPLASATIGVYEAHRLTSVAEPIVYSFYRILAQGLIALVPVSQQAGGRDDGAEPEIGGQSGLPPQDRLVG